MENYKDIQLEVNRLVKEQIDSLYSVYGLKKMDMLKAKMLLSMITRLFLLPEAHSRPFWREMDIQIGIINQYYDEPDKKVKLALLTSFINFAFEKFKTADISINPMDYLAAGEDTGNILADLFDKNKEAVLKYMELTKSFLKRIIDSLPEEANGKR